MRKFVLVSLVFVATAYPAAADQKAGTPTAELYSCTEITDDSERLACFDTAVSALKAAESSGEVQTVNRTELKAIERDAFGFSMPSLPQLFRGRADSDKSADDELKEITVAIKEIKADRNDVLTIYLEDGQIWRQIDTTYITGSRIRKAETVTIKKAAFGSFLMKLDDSNTTFRVRRLN